MLLLLAKYRFGYAAIKVKEMVEKEQARAAAEEKEIQVEREDADKRIKKLKAKLYNKFGNSINLDE